MNCIANKLNVEIVDRETNEYYELDQIQIDKNILTGIASTKVVSDNFILCDYNDNEYEVNLTVLVKLKVRLDLFSGIVNYELLSLDIQRISDEKLTELAKEIIEEYYDERSINRCFLVSRIVQTDEYVVL